MNPSQHAGAIPDKWDPRTYQFAPRGAFDWATGYDVEAELAAAVSPQRRSFPLTVKDQNGSGSCGGQAWSYYGEVLEAIATGTYEPRSARWPYANVRAPGGGSMGKELSAFVCKNGFALEAHAPSYDNGKPPSESFMAKIPHLSDTALEVAEVSRTLSYLQVPGDIESIAQAIAANHGCCIAVYGEDNGSWRGSYPKPPKTREGNWAHWLYAGKVKMIGGKKYIGVINSWGASTGENGWQWLGEEYFKNGNVWYGWTLAWDYKPALHKTLLIKAVGLLQQLFAVLSTKQK